MNKNDLIRLARSAFYGDTLAPKYEGEETWGGSAKLITNSLGFGLDREDFAGSAIASDIHSHQAYVGPDVDAVVVVAHVAPTNMVEGPFALVDERAE